VIVQQPPIDFDKDDVFIGPQYLYDERQIIRTGQRPGFATAESLSAYMAYRPKTRHTDADRNLISNIHRRGIGSSDAATCILDLAGHLIERARSGTNRQPES
jgi:ethanolamine ammonia-lyase small subunit